ncbi:unnamed protein product, partial [Darwinula stevensoni]
MAKKIRWRCVQRLLGCKGSIITSEASEDPTMTAKHNHAPDMEAIEIAKCRNAMMERAAKSHDKPNIIFAEAVRQLPDGAKAVIPTEATIKRSIRCNRRWPFVSFLMGLRWSFLRRPPSRDQSGIIGGCTTLQIRKLWKTWPSMASGQPQCLQLLTEASTWYMDGNFAMAVENFLQLYVIHVPLGETAVAAVYAFLQGNGPYRRVNTSQGNLRLQRCAPRFPSSVWNLHEATFTGSDWTNNQAEGWNHKFSRMVGHQHPSIWKAIDVLQSEQGSISTAILQTSVGLPPKKRVRRAYHTTEKQLQTQCSKYANRTITLESFLRGTGQVIRFHNIRMDIPDGEGPIIRTADHTSQSSHRLARLKVTRNGNNGRLQFNLNWNTTKLKSTIDLEFILPNVGKGRPPGAGQEETREIGFHAPDASEAKDDSLKTQAKKCGKGKKKRMDQPGVESRRKHQDKMESFGRNEPGRRETNAALTQENIEVVDGREEGLEEDLRRLKNFLEKHGKGKHILIDEVPITLGFGSIITPEALSHHWQWIKDVEARSICISFRPNDQSYTRDFSIDEVKPAGLNITVLKAFGGL